MQKNLEKYFDFELKENKDFLLREKTRRKRWGALEKEKAKLKKELGKIKAQEKKLQEQRCALRKELRPVLEEKNMLDIVEELLREKPHRTEYGYVVSGALLDLFVLNATDMEKIGLHVEPELSYLWEMESFVVDEENPDWEDLQNDPCFSEKTGLWHNGKRLERDFLSLRYLNLRRTAMDPWEDFSDSGSSMIGLFKHEVGLVVLKDRWWHLTRKREKRKRTSDSEEQEQETDEDEFPPPFTVPVKTRK
jgi:hypothetical protein